MRWLSSVANRGLTSSGRKSSAFASFSRASMLSGMPPFMYWLTLPCESQPHCSATTYWLSVLSVALRAL